MWSGMHVVRLGGAGSGLQSQVACHGRATFNAADSLACRASGSANGRVVRIALGGSPRLLGDPLHRARVRANLSPS
jgi:hypothetical protein